MPVEESGLVLGDWGLFDYKAIRGGSKKPSGKMSTTKKLRVRLSKRENGQFLIDERVMSMAAARRGIDDWKQCTDIPILAVSDDIVGEGAIIHLERCLYGAGGRLCGSRFGEQTAMARIDPAKYAKAGKKAPVAREAREIPCTPGCPMWLSWDEKSGGEKELCRWRIITTLQLLDDPVFPSPTRYRTASRYAIMSMIRSLKAISAVTGGIIAGIPLWLRQVNESSKDATGQWRTFPVVTVDFAGTVQELRAAAVAEIESRTRLNDAHDGKVVGSLPALSAVSSDDDVAIDELESLFDGDADADNESTGSPSGAGGDDVDELYTRLSLPPAARRLLEDKHRGDVEAMVTELKSMLPAPSGQSSEPVTVASGRDFDPSPGDTATGDVIDDDDDLFI